MAEIVEAAGAVWNFTMVFEGAEGQRKHAFQSIYLLGSQRRS